MTHWRRTGHAPLFVLSAALAVSAGPSARAARALEDPPAYLFTIGSYGSGPGQFGLPHGLFADALGHLYVTDAGYHRVEEFAYDGTFIRMWGSYGSAPGQFGTPWNVLASTNGYIYVAERDNSRIQKFTLDGTFVSILGSSGTGNGQFQSPYGLAEDPAGNIYVGDAGRVQVFTAAGSLVRTLGGPGTGPGQFQWARCLAFKDGSTLYVADGDDDRVQYFSTNGQFLGSWHVPYTGYCCPAGMGIDHNDNILLTEWNFVVKTTATGVQLAQWGGYGTVPGKFDNPIGITVDKNGDIYVADAINRRVQKFSGSSTTPVPTLRTSWGRIKQVYR